MNHKYDKSDAFKTFTSLPLMIGINKWWYVVKDENDYMYDKNCTSKQLYTMYKLKFNNKETELLTFEQFIIKAKNLEINFKQK